MCQEVAWVGNKTSTRVWKSSLCIRVTMSHVCVCVCVSPNTQFSLSTDICPHINNDKDCPGSPGRPNVGVGTACLLQ